MKIFAYPSIARQTRFCKPSKYQFIFIFERAPPVPAVHIAVNLHEPVCFEYANDFIKERE